MKKNYFFKFILFLIPFSAIVLMSNSTGRVAEGNTGSPGDGGNGNTCAKCHSGGSFNGAASITTNIPTSGYALDTDYTITVVLANTNAPRAGYQLTAEKVSDNSKVGSFSSGTNAKVFNSNQHVTHTNPIDHGGSMTVDVVWRSPSTDAGAVKFYAAIAAVNNTGGTGGDNVFTASSSNSTLGIAKENLLNFVMYPNPSTDFLTIQLPSGSTQANVSVFDLSGRELRSSKITSSINKVDVKDLSTGMYLLRIESEGKIGSKQFIKQ